jgi:Prokaryotic E2 family E
MSFLPAPDADYLLEKRIAYKEIQDASRKGIVLLSYCLPAARFDAGKADILIILPPGYADVAPDMFYLLPWVRLAAVNRYPKAADQPFSFGGHNWQRWSRHNTEWRPGVDGIWTMVKRIDAALQAAAA